MDIRITLEQFNKICELTDHYDKTKSITTATELAKLMVEIMKFSIHIHLTTFLVVLKLQLMY